MEILDRPLYQSYRVAGNVFAGEYPGDKYGEKAETKIRQMVHFGVRHFVDLTEEGEMNPYAQLLPDDCTYTRFPIRDVSVPKSVEEAERCIYRIQELSRRNDGYVYIHCWGGVGRTGTIVACYLAEQMEEPTFEDVLGWLRDKFTIMPKSSHRITPETKEQEAFIAKYVEGVKGKGQVRELRIQDCVRGSLMAGAAGDALGYPVEFMSRRAILSRYGDKGITRFEIDSGIGKALVSDDTQMTLFTANGMLMGVTRGAMRGVGGIPEDYVDGAYLDWYYTQSGLKSDSLDGKDFHYTWLRDLPELARRRAPGTTCMSACESLRQYEKPHNNSKGCGGIMRVAPMGLFNAVHKRYPQSRLAEAGAKIASVTHLHPLGYLPAALLTMLIDRLVPLTSREAQTYIYEIIQDGLDIMMKMEGEEHNSDKIYLKELTNKAVELSQSGISDADAIRQLGEGWTGDEAWAISLYCALRHIDSMRDAIIAAVNHDGDSDSTGSITGNIMGAIYGYEAIKRERLFCPEGREFEDTIELANIILALADDLYNCYSIFEKSWKMHDSPIIQQWYARYCEMKPVGI